MSMLKHVLGFFAHNKIESMNGNFNTLVQYTIKYLLMPSVLCFLPWSIQAEDKTIDGINLNYLSEFTLNKLFGRLHSSGIVGTKILEDFKITDDILFILFYFFPFIFSFYTYFKIF